MGTLTSKVLLKFGDEPRKQSYQQFHELRQGIGDVRLRQPMALSLDIASEGGGIPLSGDDEKPIRANELRRNFPNVYALAVLGAFALLFTIVYGLDEWLPSPLNEDEAEQYPERFNAHRAHKRLIELVAFGVKSAGSETNDYAARLWIEEQLRGISVAAHETKRVEIDTQYITGSFHMAFSNRFTSNYDGLVNVVARLSDVHRNTTEALLVNCHFDSVPGSPGASDDGINCVHMLEILQILSRHDKPLTHNIIFLFNGAEENILQGSHGFITAHKWAKSVKAYVNLESCGAGGREILFQTAVHHPWLLEAYAESVPRPHGFVVGEEIFQTGLIPSDTDFRIFRDFGNLPGLDFAYYHNGYVYHTGFDDLNQTSKESIQHTGDNLLALVSHLAKSPYLNGPHEHTGNRTVFWDLFGFKMVHYSQTTGAVVGLCVILLSVYTTVSTLLHLGPGMRRKELCYQGLKALVGPFIGWLMAIAWCCLLALFLDFIANSMTWYSQPLIVLPLYAVPTFLFATLGLCLQYVLTKLSPLCGEVRVQLYSLGVQLIWTVLLLALTLLGSRSAYLLQLMVFFPSLASFLVLWFARPGGRIGTWLWLQLGALVVPTSIAFYHVLPLLHVFLPVMGRMGSNINSELFMAIIICISTLLCTSYFAPMVPLLQNPKRVFEVLALVHLVGLAFVLSPLSFPYTGMEQASPAPQRVYIFQVQREFFTNEQKLYHSDSGLWFLNMDRNSPSALVHELPLLEESRVISPDCRKNLTCGLPVYSPRWLSLSPGSLWLPIKEFPSVDQKTTLTLKQKSKRTANVYRLDFEVTGPSHLSVVLCPFQGITLNSWSLAAEILSTGLHEDRPYYFIYVGREYRRATKTWGLTIDLKVPSNYSDDLVEVVVMGHYFTGVPNGPVLTEILTHKPTWSHATVWSSSYTSHLF